MIHGTQSVALMVCYLALAQAEAHIAHYYVVGIDGEWVVCHADAIAGSRLSCNGDIAGVYRQCRFQEDGARHLEHYNAFARLIQGPAQRTLTRVVEVGDIIHLAASAAGDVASVAFSTREGRLFLLCVSGSDSSQCYHYHRKKFFQIHIDIVYLVIDLAVGIRLPHRKLRCKITKEYQSTKQIISTFLPMLQNPYLIDIKR